MDSVTLIEEVQAGRLPALKVRRAIRVAANISQIRMAAELGVHRSTFIRWEDGIFEPRGEKRARYAKLLRELELCTSEPVLGGSA
jgi:transcriptional regulator with XRE-family HTH domain